MVSGVDLVRDGDGVYRVLEDNLRTPSGISYVLENRATLTRVLRSPSRSTACGRSSHYRRRCWRRSAASRRRRPATRRVVVLTPGAYNSAYFEHAFLARQMGVELVEGRDLVVDEHVVYMRTTARPASASTSSIAASTTRSSIPAVFRSDSTLGVPGIVTAARAGNVTIANAIGNGVADDKAIYAYVPALIRYYLARSRSSRTSRPICSGIPSSARRALDRLDQLVVKPVAASGGYGIVIGPRASDEELAEVPAADRGEPARLHRAGGDLALAPPDVRSTAASKAATSTSGRSCSPASASR